MINKCFVPFPKLETERLILRETQNKDVEQLYEILSDAEVAKFDYFYPLTSNEEVMEFIKRYKNELEENEEITWGIILKETNKLIGTCCLGDFDEGARRTEIGYDISQAEWGKGYATEAIEAVIDFGFKAMNLNRIEATITPGNDASVKVLEKLNFVQCRDENLDSSWGEIRGIYLLPAYWNQGIGTELINWGINELENRGYKKISLWVLEENTNARYFYEKIGFKLDGTIKELNIGKPLNEYRYVKTIA